MRVGLLGPGHDATRVRLGGVPLADLGLAQVRRRVVVAEPTAHLFTGSLRGELDVRLRDGAAASDGRAWPSPAKLDAIKLDALHTADAHDVLDAVPDGLDGHVTEKGRSLSGGQRQRLALARALLTEAEVLVLVEPTSAVDAHTEARIARRLAEARAGRTTVLVTASPLVLDRVDHVVLLGGGRVLAAGVAPRAAGGGPRRRRATTATWSPGPPPPHPTAPSTIRGRMTVRLPVADPTMLREHTLALLRHHRRALGGVLVLHALAALAGLAGPWLLGRIVDAVAGGTTTTFVDRAAAGLVVAVLAQTLLIRSAQRSARVLGETVFADLREEFLTTVTRLPLSVVEQAGTGDLVGRTTNDVNRAQHSVRFGVPRILVTSATGLLTVVAAVVVDWRVALSLGVGVPLLVLTTRWYLHRATEGYLRESAAYATLNGSITESVEGARTVDALALGRRRRQRVDDDLREAFAAESRTLFLRSVLFPGVDVSFVLPIAATLLWGAHLVSTGLSSVGAVTTVALYALALRGPIGELIYWLDEIQIGATSLARIIGVRSVAPDRIARVAGARRRAGRRHRPAVRLPRGPRRAARHRPDPAGRRAPRGGRPLRGRQVDARPDARRDPPAHRRDRSPWTACGWSTCRWRSCAATWPW